MWKLTTSQTTILFPLYYDGNKHENTNLTKLHAAFTFERVHVASLQIYEYFMLAIISTICIMILHALSHKIIFAVLDVVWLLTQCFRLLSFFYIYIVQRGTFDRNSL